MVAPIDWSGLDRTLVVETLRWLVKAGIEPIAPNAVNDDDNEGTGIVVIETTTEDSALANAVPLGIILTVPKGMFRAIDGVTLVIGS